MDVGAQAAVGAGGDVLSADELSQCDDGIDISSGCSTRSVEWLTTLGRRIFPAGSFTSRQTLNSVKKRLPTLSQHALCGSGSRNNLR